LSLSNYRVSISNIIYRQKITKYIIKLWRL
jgi:hypothetical protein